ncbi:spore germination protein (amino acid permease) [Paenibacillus sp. yr247]|uniref:GerAB/ArcD/ProY family transporter n=1 Tax=Paenibacillus sp. yr247 TaxID=1761880 RepID=UPI00087EC768|nr:GerAB/ArcD/ProY family transporter [Paenibacillus sp. yr247]SDN43282.1 spore germination protein (amino acid permease) [Paenibacillus sp. yr247]
MQKLVKENYLMSGFFAFFLVHATQNGLSIMFYQNLIFEDAGRDAWISIVLTGLSLHFIIWMMYKMLGYPAKDVIDLHRMMFGNFFGNAISLLMVGYFFILALSVFRGYIEIIEVWMFPTLKTWVLALLLICIIYYLVSGGLRVLTGFSLFSVLFSIIIMLLLFFPLQNGQRENLFPLFDHSIQDMLKSCKSSSILFIGFETLLLYFPFLKFPEKSAKWAHFGLLSNTIQYFIAIVATTLYFSQGMIKHTNWHLLVMTKSVEFSLIARFEFIVIGMWLIILIPVLCISIWSCTRIIKRVTNLKPQVSLLFILITFFIAALPFNDRFKAEALGKFVGVLGFYFIYAYIPLLFIIYLIVSKRKKA